MGRYLLRHYLIAAFMVAIAIGILMVAGTTTVQAPVASPFVMPFGPLPVGPLPTLTPAPVYVTPYVVRI